MQPERPIPAISGINLDPKTGVVTLKIVGDLGTYDLDLDHPLVEIFNAVMSYASNPPRLASKKETGDEMEYIHFTPEFPEYSKEENLTICKLNPCNNHGTKSQIIFLRNVQETFIDFLPILMESIRCFFKRPDGFSLYEQKLEQIKSLDRQIQTKLANLGSSNDPTHIAKDQSHLANLEEDREREARELKKGLKNFLVIIGLPIPASKIKYHDDFANRVADLLDAGKEHEAKSLIVQKNFYELLDDYAEDDPA